MIRSSVGFLPLPILLAVLAAAGSAVVPLGAASAQSSAETGRRLAGQCATCHGLDGIAKMPDMPTIAGSAATYIERQLLAYRSGQRQHEVMSIIAKGLEDQAIRDLAKWYSSVKVEAKLP
ncbi:c-type cytochrome [Chthonobacter rhizosphaerae]|uniref:c-type cytochrome n=1 Tax=Chthonobacter rhizosphaerae TaxID=2735553 RepID=UPI0015EE5284|nr:c-type cytochrome [Chthonobacter rhizosphaerae]